MGNIITKKDLDLVIESTLKENGLLSETKEVKVKPVKKVAKPVIKEGNKQSEVQNLISEDLKRFNAIINHKLK